MNVFDFINPLINLLQSDKIEMKLSVLDNLGETVNILNKYFKDKVVGELWEITSFSLKEAITEPDVEKPANLLYDVTLGIISLEQMLLENNSSNKHWRSIKMLYEQLLIIIDGKET